MAPQPLNKECALEMIVEFLLYRLGPINMTTEEIQNHPIINILTIVYRNDVKKWIFNDNIHFLFMDGNFIFRNEPQEAAIYLGAEDIVWLIVNLSDPLLNLKTILQTTAVLGVFSFFILFFLIFL